MVWLTRGRTSIQPQRSLMVRLAIFNDDTMDLATDTEKLRIFQKTLGIAEAQIMDPAILARVLVDAVMKQASPTAVLALNISETLGDLWDWIMYQCCVADHGVQNPNPTTTSYRVGGLAPRWHRKNGDVPTHQKPVIVVDEINFVPTVGGPVQHFLYNLASLAHHVGVVVYMCTNNRRAAYRIWRYNGGNYLVCHDACNGTLGTLVEQNWATFKREERLLTDEEKNCLETTAAWKNPNFYLNSLPFSFDKRARKELLLQIYSKGKSQPFGQALEGTIDALFMDPEWENSSIAELCRWLDSSGYRRQL